MIIVIYESQLIKILLILIFLMEIWLQFIYYIYELKL